MRTIWLLAIASVCLVSPGVAPAEAQVELDRIVARVGARVVTQSDVSQARRLKLVDDTSSDAAVQRGLEDRLLTLDEVSRAAPLAPGSEGDLAARRANWERSLGGEAAARALLEKSAMNDAALVAWFRDDLRIQAYLRRQFSAVPESERAKATADWLARLRQRAGLK